MGERLAVWEDLVNCHQVVELDARIGVGDNPEGRRRAVLGPVDDPDHPNVTSGMIGCDLQGIKADLRCLGIAHWYSSTPRRSPLFAVQPGRCGRRRPGQRGERRRDHRAGAGDGFQEPRSAAGSPGREGRCARRRRSEG